MDREAWSAAIHGVTKSRTQLKWLNSSSSSSRLSTRETLNNFSQDQETLAYGPASPSILSSLLLSFSRVLTGSWTQSQKNVGTHGPLPGSGQEKPPAKPHHFSNALPFLTPSPSCPPGVLLKYSQGGDLRTVTLLVMNGASMVAQMVKNPPAKQ